MSGNLHLYNGVLWIHVNYSRSIYYNTHMRPFMVHWEVGVRQTDMGKKGGREKSGGGRDKRLEGSLAESER